VNWFGLLLVILLTPVLICGLWLVAILIADALKPDPPQVCACGRRVLVDDRVLKHHGDQMVHSRVLCQPFREWVEP
jgi:hypothetical protein